MFQQPYDDQVMLPHKVKCPERGIQLAPDILSAPASQNAKNKGGIYFFCNEPKANRL